MHIELINHLFCSQFSPPLLRGRMRSQWTLLIRTVTQRCLMTGKHSGFVRWDFRYLYTEFLKGLHILLKYCFWLSSESASLAGWLIVLDAVCFCFRLKEFKTALLEVFRSSHAQSVGMIALIEGINKSCPSPFKDTEVRAALSRMQDDNQVMVADDIIFLI